MGLAVFSKRASEICDIKQTLLLTKIMRARMKLVGFFLLLAGWLIVLAAVAVLGAGLPRAAFVLSGIAVEILGLALVVRAHPVLHGGRG
jgi:hypothetical protein